MNRRDLAVWVGFAIFTVVLGAALLATKTQPTPTAIKPAAHHDISTSDFLALGAPWPVLSDGRLVLDIFNRRVALSPCDTCQLDIELRIGSYHADTVYLTWGDVIREPVRLRRALTHADHVEIRSGNLPNMKGKLFGRFERSGMPVSQELTLVIYRKPVRYSDCAAGKGPLGAPPCEFLLKAANEPERADPAGFVVNHGHFYGGTDKDTLYISTDAALRSAVGLPPFFICNWAAVCANDLNPRDGPGYLVAPDVGIAFSFVREDYPETEWLRLQQKVQSIFDDLVINKE